MECKINYFANLPTELTLYILAVLDEPLTARLVCKIWKEIAEDRINTQTIAIQEIYPNRFKPMIYQCKKKEKESAFSHNIRLIKKALSHQNAFLPKEMKWTSDSLYTFKTRAFLSGLREKEITVAMNQTICFFGEAIVKKYRDSFDRYEGEDILLIKADWFREQFKKHGPSFREIYLNSCNLKQLPDEIEAFKNLQKLDLCDNQLTSLSDSIGGLSNLRVLNFNHNKLASLPDSIGKLSKLTELHLYNNWLTFIPDSIDGLFYLRWLYIHKNKLTNLPDCISALKSRGCRVYSDL